MDAQECEQGVLKTELRHDSRGVRSLEKNTTHWSKFPLWQASSVEAPPPLPTLDQHTVYPATGVPRAVTATRAPTLARPRPAA